MDRALIKGIIVGGVAVTAAAAIGVTGLGSAGTPAFAEVLAVKEIRGTEKVPREECADVAVQRRAPVADTNRIAGTVAGALAGGWLGSAVGGGNGKKLATVAGAAAGGYAGNTIQKRMQDQDVQTVTERRCKTVYDRSEKIVGYDVTYRLGGKDGSVRMSHAPGARIPVKDGKLVLEGTAAS